MVRVKIHGLMRLKMERTELHFNAERLDELLEKIIQSDKKIKLQDLKNSVIFVNGVNITHLKVFKTPLKAGDEVNILSPAGGG